MATAPKPPAPVARPKVRRWRRWRKILLWGLGLPTLVALGVGGYYYASFSKMIDERLHGERIRTLPSVYARPLEIRRGQWLSLQQVVDRLNDLGYAQRPALQSPAEFTVGDQRLSLIARGGPFEGRTITLTFNPKAGALLSPPGKEPKVHSGVIDKIQVDAGAPVESVTLDTPLLTSLITTGREKRRRIAIGLIPKHMAQAVLAIEDRRFYAHPGIDPIRIVGAIVTNMRGTKPYLVGASTVTQQLVKNFFLTPEKSYKRKIQEQFLAVVLETRATKDEILELYLNDVYLGQRGSFAIHGVAEAARLFFGKDITNVSLAEAATIAGVIQAPYTHSPFTSLTNARDRRNVVLQAMVDGGYVKQTDAEKAGREPMVVARQALDTAAPYFVDLIGQTLTDQFPGLLNSAQPVEIYTTLDIGLQRMAQEAVASGITNIDDLLAKKRIKGKPQVALIAISARTGEVLAFVGGRSYNQSQYNRALRGRRQPGSVFKPFVYLAAFERAAADGRTDITPATMVDDTQTTFTFEDKVWTPGNYEDEYDGMIPLRRALAHSRNVATIKLAEMVGFDTVADFWKRFGSATAPRPYPSITLGVFEATPMEIAEAYTIFPNHGRVTPLRSISRIVNGGQDLALPAAPQKQIARADTTFLVTNMMRSVVNEGTGAGIRGLGFALDAAGKTGTTNDLRDAWFVGFTPEIVTAVWVGFDDNQPLGLSGAIAALPIWTKFMLGATAGRPNLFFEPPAEGVVWADIDRDTGKLVQPGCPRPFREAFLAGTEPTEICQLHRY